mmetsp:Transcript_28116/g.36841  ORF Transcript_28116/g.36841 Transcript_28116/m.36841 type:complete len:560 (-) Transcript_28116:276-1955(-)
MMAFSDAVTRLAIYSLPIIVTSFSGVWLWSRQFRRKEGEPPLESGRIPFLGVAISFSRHAGKFLQEMKRKHGDIFTIFLAGNRMHFITDLHSFKRFFKSETLSFDKVAEAIAQNAFGYSKLSAYPEYKAEDVKKLYIQFLQGKELEALVSKFQKSLLKTMSKRVEADSENCNLGLYEWVYSVMFEASCNALYGEGFYAKEILNSFQALDEQFPLLAAQVPANLIIGKQVETNREFLSKKLDEALKNNPDDTSNFIQAREDLFKDTISNHDRKRMHLTMLWASQANTIPAVFWALGYILSNHEAKAQVLDELSRILERKRTAKVFKKGGFFGGMLNRNKSDEHLPSIQQSFGANVTFNKEEIGQMVVLESCINEAFRLATASLMLREVEADMDFETSKGEVFKFRKGDQVVLSPYLNHMDEEIFGKDPELFRYDRYLETSLDGVQSLKRYFTKDGKKVLLTQSLMPFGGGVSMCPGRFFAAAEIKLFTAHVLLSYPLDLKGDITKLSMNQSRAGLGILPPEGDIPFSFTPSRRDSPSKSSLDCDSTSGEPLQSFEYSPSA